MESRRVTMKQPTIEMGFGLNEVEVYGEPSSHSEEEKEALDRGSSKWTRVVEASAGSNLLVGVFRIQDDIDLDSRGPSDGGYSHHLPGELHFLPDWFKGRAAELTEER